MGLASHVVPAGQLSQALSNLVAALLAKPPEALRQTQALLRREATDEILARMELENGHFAERLTSDEVREAIIAFFASRAKA
jgi:enoyl-CoA hydratase/carnithine racemase